MTCSSERPIRNLPSGHRSAATLAVLNVNPTWASMVPLYATTRSHPSPQPFARQRKRRIHPIHSPPGRICDWVHTRVILSAGAQRRSRKIWAKSRWPACGNKPRSLDKLGMTAPVVHDHIANGLHPIADAPPLPNPAIPRQEFPLPLSCLSRISQFHLEPRFPAAGSRCRSYSRLSRNS